MPGNLTMLSSDYINLAVGGDAMPPGMYNNFEHNRNADWGNMLEARQEFEDSLKPSSGADFGQIMLIGGAAIFGAILIAMALFAS